MATETAASDAQNPSPTSNSTPELQNLSNGEMPVYHESQTCDDIDSSCSTPYVSAPSSPGRGSGSGGFFYSAPASPMHFALCAMPSPSTFTAASSSTDAEFEFSARLACYGDSAAATSTMISADELFLNGQIRPMKLSTHLQRPQPLAPLPDTDTETDDGDGDRGRDPRLRARSLRRRTRSLSPLRQSPPHHWNDHDEEHKNDPVSATKNTETASFSSSSNRSSKRWIFLKDFLYRSKSEGSSNSHTHSHKSWSFTHVKPKKSAARKESPAVPAGKRRVASASPGEVHYTAKRAQAEELRKRTFLPYKQGLLGCLGFSHRGYGLARALNPVSSR
ncbi:hypothetical protein CK203_078197 [Vitis vinifera]|uniref:Uncharacterized protein n=1 Tax=Vitis vinifera TaxID=29760 RepID=A0A438DUT2_VITVI|nr:hypothetical protein CK203_078197 [Vitis vinifera]